MKRHRPVTVSLGPDHVRVLDRLSKRAGSRSAAIQRMLEAVDRRRDLDEMEAAYREYYADPRAVGEAAALTRDLNKLASYPPEWEAPRGKHGKRKRQAG